MLLTLNARDDADAQQQWHYQRLNALAAALHDETRPPYLTAAQPAPHATPRVNTVGSADAAQLAARVEQLEAAHWSHRHTVNTGSVPAIQVSSQHIDALERAVNELEARVQEIGTGRGRPCRNPNLYLIRTPDTETLIRGEAFAFRAAQHYTLNTHELPGPLRDRLTMYLMSGDSSKPYWYCQKRRRYYARSGLPDYVPPLFQALNMHLTRNPIANP